MVQLEVTLDNDDNLDRITDLETLDAVCRQGNEDELLIP